MAEEESILSIDFGEKRVGLALSVPGFKISQPYGTVELKDVWKELEKIFTAHKIKTVIVGFPLLTNGKEAKPVPAVKRFAKELSSKFNVPVKLWDERFSTKSAEQLLRTLGKYPCRDKKQVDKIAAAIILEEYLSRD